MGILCNRNGETITTEDESQILDTILKWLDRDVRETPTRWVGYDERLHSPAGQAAHLFIDADMTASIAEERRRGDHERFDRGHGSSVRRGRP